MKYTFNWKMKLGLVFVVIITIFTLLSSFFYGGVVNQAKQQVICLKDGLAVDRQSEYKWLLNTCSINRGTAENPNWVISKRDMGLDASDVTIDNVGN